jgi:hypothetical protein
MMAGIYMMAKKTFSWLGPAADDSDYAMTGIFSMSYRMYEHRTALPSVAGEWRDPTGWLKAEYTYWLQRDLDDCNDALSRGATWNRFWRGARKLLARPYWDRAWVVQEVVLSRDVMVCCGTLHIPLGSIWLIALWLREIEGLPRPSFVDEMVWRQLSSSWGRILLGWALVLRLRKIREISRSRPRQDEIEKGGSTWRDLVVQTMGNQATDPRDKVYSVRRLLNLPIVPDYSRSVEEIYCDFATLCIQTDLCFNYTLPSAGHGLSLAASGTKPDSPPYRLFVPSWAPNWDMLSKERFFLPLEQGIRRENPEQGRTVDPRELSATFDGRELNVGGLPCDRVAVSRILSDEPGQSWASFCEMAMARLGESYEGLGIPILQALTRLVFLDRNLVTSEPLGKRPDPGLMVRLGFYAILVLTKYWEEGQQEPKKVAERFGFTSAEAVHGKLVGEDSTDPRLEGFREQTLIFLRSFVSRQTGRNSDVDSTGYYRSMDFWAGGWPAELVHDHAWKLFSTKAAFVSEKGLMGWGPAGLEADDLICIVGGHLPVVLRKVGSHYLHIGTCFVLGLDDGDGFEAATNGCQVEKFHIV